MRIYLIFQYCIDFFDALEFVGLFYQILDIYYLVRNLIIFLHVLGEELNDKI